MLCQQTRCIYFPLGMESVYLEMRPHNGCRVTVLLFSTLWKPYKFIWIICPKIEVRGKQRVAPVVDAQHKSEAAFKAIRSDLMWLTLETRK